MEQKTTFWKFLTIDSQKIAIPVIQRDYAQGRKGKEVLRQKFLYDIKNALESDSPLQLDFVYGQVEKIGNEYYLYPLDGQQRLTTLWLLHWYIAFKSGELKNHNDEFRNFTYETRDSSKEFFSKLCDLGPLSDDERQEESVQNKGGKGVDNKLRQHICNQRWFLSKWEDDPTVQAALNTLCGVYKEDKRGNYINNGIDDYFKDLDNYGDYWKKLIGENCPISFYYFDINQEKVKLTDDIYVKMNARGKKLTDFENFKADLLAFYQEKEWDNSLDRKEKIGYLIDNTWTDVFWTSIDDKSKGVDDVFFAFINRFILNEYVAKRGSNDGYLQSVEDVDKSALFNTLYDNDTEYNDFKLYRNPYINDDGEEFLKNVFDKIKNVLAFYGNCKPMTEVFKASWHEKKDSGLDFIPKYNKDGKISDMTQPERIVFYAACRFFENNLNNKFIEEKFKDWIQFVWNITNQVGTKSAMISGIRYIADIVEEVSNKEWDINAYLRDNPKYNFAKQQVKEEIAKAKQILTQSNPTKEEIKSTENELHDYRGAIRFLLDVEGEDYNFNNYDTKKRIFLKRFGGQGNEYASIKTIKFLFSNVVSVENELFKKLIRNKTNCFDTWQSILVPSEDDLKIERGEIVPIVKNLLTSFKSTITPKSDVVIHAFAETNLMEKIKELKDDKLNGGRIQSYCGSWCLYPKQATSENRIHLDWRIRDEILTNLKISTITIEGKEYDCIKVDKPTGESWFYRGDNIGFEYDNIKYKWISENIIEVSDQNVNDIDLFWYKETYNYTFEKKNDNPLQYEVKLLPIPIPTSTII